MRIEEYLSFKYKGETPLEEHQYVTAHEREHYADNVDALRVELWRFFNNRVYKEEKLSKRFSFLDYQLQAYPEDKRDFMAFVKRTPYDMSDEVVDVLIRYAQEGLMEDVVKEWLDEQKAKESVTNLGYTTAPDNDHRLKVMHRGKLLDAALIQAWFERELLNKTHKGNLITTPEDFDTFLHANFAGFKKVVTIHPGKKLKVYATGALLRNIMYRFYLEFRNGERDKELREGVCIILKNTFELFKDQELITISGKLHEHYSERP